MATATVNGIDHEARLRLREQSTYSDPDRECDVVMKGGITSGVLYPLAVCELASTYRLRSVGGTSAGAIAAAGAAAAEYGRHSLESGAGFVGLAELPEWSAQPGNLVGVFQPADSTKGLHRLLMAAIAKPTASMGKATKVWNVLSSLLTAALGRYAWVVLVAVAPGIMLLWALDWAPSWDWGTGVGLAVCSLIIIGAAVGLVTGSRPPTFLHCVPQTERDRQMAEWDAGGTKRWARTLGLSVVIVGAGAAIGLLIGAAASPRIAWGAALAVAGIAVGLVVGCVVSVILGAGRGLSGNMYGIVAGSSPSKSSLSDWLTELIDELAGHGEDRPLTFGDLWTGPTEATTGEGAFVNLEMLTTCLTQGRPYRLPHALGERFFFDPKQFERIFPSRVVNYLSEYQDTTERSPSDQRERDELVSQAAARGLKPLPPAGDLPVVVATRMSLSFPILISAVPLHAIDYTCKGLDGQFRFETCWFSDGGITSNFPITFFDSLLPRRPTFGINLRDFHPAHPKSEGQECDNTWMPHKNNSGLKEWWARQAGAGGIGSVVGFLAGIADTMQNWVDNQQIGVPGYRDRIVHVYHDDTEGGMNLDMPSDTLERLSERGRCAGARLVQYYTTEEDGRTVSWDNHRWVRMRSTLALMERATRAIAAAYPDGYQDDLHRPQDELPSYKWASKRQRALAITLMEGTPDAQPEPPLAEPSGLVDIGEVLSQEIGTSPSMTLGNDAPSPLPRLELRPGD